MQVGIFHIGDIEGYLKLGSLAAQVAKHTMPGVNVVHLTDFDTPQIHWTDSAIRTERNCPMAVFRMRHQQILGEWLFIDPDVLIRKPVDNLFEDYGFSIALANRKPGDGTTNPDTDPLFKEMPHNTGVVFSRCPEFFHAVEKELLTYDAEMQEWMGDQLAINRIKDAWNCKLLPSGYNFPPGRDGKVGSVHIAHYKGHRKPLMVEHAFKILHGINS